MWSRSWLEPVLQHVCLRLLGRGKGGDGAQWSRPDPLLAGVTGLQSPIISIDPHSMAVRRGADVSFRCRVHDGAQPIELSWKMPNNQLEGRHVGGGPHLP